MNPLDQNFLFFVRANFTGSLGMWQGEQAGLPTAPATGKSLPEIRELKRLQLFFKQ